MATTTIYAATSTNGRGIIAVSNTDWDDLSRTNRGSIIKEKLKTIGG